MGTPPTYRASPIEEPTYAWYQPVMRLTYAWIFIVAVACNPDDPPADTTGSRMLTGTTAWASSKGLMRATLLIFALGLGCSSPLVDSSGGSLSSSSTAAEAETGQTTGSVPTGDVEDVSWRRICDGSDGLRMAVRVVGHEDVPTLIAHEIGNNYLYVRGDCRYWVVDDVPSELIDWKVTYTGVLAPDVEEQLSRELQYDRWGELAGIYLGPSNPGGYELQYFDASAIIRCELGCTSDVTAPQDLKDMTPIVRTWFERLRLAGQPLAEAEPMRVDVLRVVLPNPVNDNPCAFEWPFAFDPTPLARNGEDPPGWSRLISDEASASMLRSMRGQYLAGDVPPGTCNLPLDNSAFLFFEADAPEIAFSLWMRDHVPLERPEGGITAPDLP